MTEKPQGGPVLRAGWAGLIVTTTRVLSTISFPLPRNGREFMQAEADALCHLAGQVRIIYRNSSGQILAASLFFGTSRNAEARWLWGGRNSPYKWVSARPSVLEVRFGAMGQFVVKSDTEEVLATSSA